MRQRRRRRLTEVEKRPRRRRRLLPGAATIHPVLAAVARIEMRERERGAFFLFAVGYSRLALHPRSPVRRWYHPNPSARLFGNALMSPSFLPSFPPNTRVTNDNPAEPRFPPIEDLQQFLASQKGGGRKEERKGGKRGHMAWADGGRSSEAPSEGVVVGCGGERVIAQPRFVSIVLSILPLSLSL